MKTLKRLAFFVSLFLVYIVIREMLLFFNSAFSIHPILGYVAITATVAVMIWFLILPLLKILMMPRYPGPVEEKSLEEELIQARLRGFRNSQHLKKENFKFDDNRGYRKVYGDAVSSLGKRCDTLRQGYVRRLFYGTTVSQNGFLDAILILSSSINMVRDIFVLYAGRVSNRDLLTIGKMVYYSTVIGGSESVEYLTEELFSKLASDGVKGIPFLGRVTGSIADGFVNAALLTRVSFITENYCGMTLVERRSDLYPKFKTVYSTTKHIVSGLLGDARAMAKNRLGKGFLEKLTRFFGKGTEEAEV